MRNSRVRNWRHSTRIPTLMMYAPMRIDHHGWQLACLALTVAGLADPRRARGGATVGLSSALSLTIGLEMFARMSGEIGRMGAVTPHELMRFAEMTFIRDCAELATSASLVRTESRC